MNESRPVGRPRYSEYGTRRTSVTLDSDVWDMLQVVSEMRGESVSRIINDVLRSAMRPSRRIQAKRAKARSR